MSTEQNNQNLTQKVMQKIKSGEVKMKPKLFFVFGSLFLGAGLGGVLVFSIFFFNIFFHRLRIFAPFGFLKLGRFGFQPFLTLFPWDAILLAVCGVFIGIILLRHYDISYKKNFIGIAVGLAALIFAFGFFLDKWGFNEWAKKAPLPVGPFYPEHFFGRSWVIGQINQMGETGVTIETPDGQKIVVSWNQRTPLPPGIEFRIGDVIRAVGEWQKETFTAERLILTKPELRNFLDFNPKFNIHWEQRNPPSPPQ